VTVPAAQVVAPRRAAGAWLVGLALVAFVAFVLVRIADLLLVLFIATLLAVVLGGLTDILTRRLRVPRGVGLVLSLALMLGLLAALVSLLAPAIGVQVQDFAESVPRYLSMFVLVMGRLAGLLGLFVAVPLLATLLVVLRHVLIYQIYGERPKDPMVHAVLQPRRTVERKAEGVA
jgi:predicted PurR-regulated permease PerM